MKENKQTPPEVIVIVKIVQQSCDNIPDIVEIPNVEDVSHIVKARGLETRFGNFYCCLNTNSKT